MRSPYAIGGSGSSYVQGFIHEHFKQNMTRAEAVDFVRKSKFICLKGCKKTFVFPYRIE